MNAEYGSTHGTQTSVEFFIDTSLAAGENSTLTSAEVVASRKKVASVCVCAYLCLEESSC